MARYSCVYDLEGKLLEIGPPGTAWFRCSDAKAALPFKVVDNVEISDAAAAVMQELAQGGGGNGADKTAAQLAEAPAIDKAAAAKALVDAAIAEVLSVKPATTAKAVK